MDQPVPSPKGKICIIDDEPDMGETCADILRAQGYEVFPFQNGDAGIAAANEHVFDVLITDLMMPGMSGLYVLREIKKASPDTRVILFTGYPTIETAVEAMKEGAFEYIVKPFMANKLIALVEKAMAAKPE